MRFAGARTAGYFAAGLAVVGATLLSWPPSRPDVDPGTGRPFRWDADGLFHDLEAEFVRTGNVAVEAASDTLSGLVSSGDSVLSVVSRSGTAPLGELNRLASLQFEMAVQGAAHPRLIPTVLDFVGRSRVAVMKAAAEWPLDRPTHEALYRVLYGGRIAIDEALAQVGESPIPELVAIEDVASATPSLVVEGVRIHSGDILLSRGGAPTSALIARGNDFPNTFSHAALVHVDERTGEGTVVESLIEVGSVLSSVSEYLAAKKHRILVLRLRADHPALALDPLLPHRAAQRMLDRVRGAHIPYDFAMDWRDDSRALCSEIVYHGYHDLGIELWALKASMSAPGLRAWLSEMGVREFTSLVPSDLEYDPQVRAVVEWRNLPALMEYRRDNAITDALLEEAERGARLGYAWRSLPLARLVKAYSTAASWVGGHPVIPQGMSAPAALGVRALVEEVHPPLQRELDERAKAFRRTHGYPPPYWTLVGLAREALRSRRDSLRPALASPSLWKNAL